MSPRRLGFHSSMQEDNKEPRKEKVKVTPKTKSEIKLSRLKRRLLKHVWLVRGGLVGLVLVALYALFLFVGSLLGNLGIATYFSMAKNFVFTPDANIEAISGRTNILILGKGGEEHEAPDLTDTIIFASVSHEKGGISLISLPRDIWISELRAKLNSAYYWGNQKEEGGGIVLAKSTVEEIVGEPIHYGLIVDFSSFKEVIDDLGGVEVEVENSFTDERYPIPGKEDAECDGDPEFACRYETVSFKEGTRMMDGETALKFARSRNAEGDEGTDIARARRQQKIIAAVQKKVLSPSTIFSPRKVRKLFGLAGESIETDITPQAGAILARRLLQARGSIDSHVLDGGYLENPPVSSRYDNLYVFIPTAGDWSKVHEWVESLLP